jgi:ribokinase
VPPAIAVVGSVNLDLVASCPRLPRAGETVSAQSFNRYPGGKGANQALAARRCGADVTLIGAVGDDPEAQAALALLSSDGVDLTHVSVTEAPTGLALIAVDAEGENQIVVIPGANHAIISENVDTAGYEAVLCQLEIPPETVSAAARTATGLFCVNAAPARDLPEEVLGRSDVIIVNETERDALGDSLVDISALVVVTLGAAGAKAYRNRRLVTECQPPPVDPIDTVGAGDAFCGALVTSLAEGASVERALSWAVTAGALATTRHGAQPSLPTRAEIESARR